MHVNATAGSNGPSTTTGHGRSGVQHPQGQAVLGNGSSTFAAEQDADLEVIPVYLRSSAALMGQVRRVVVPKVVCQRVCRSVGEGVGVSHC